jgi:hypothetical protein
MSKITEMEASKEYGKRHFERNIDELRYSLSLRSNLFEADNIRSGLSLQTIG